ncbi:hypothetical protein F4821DRAFT_60121 [Hypoxylon rubiginosum]|uniref:Uncharacterized protein n=1 Tax=Hypoxylon rubiginosum TaxID=110542 RepID=A0ACC0DA38_9PEZI|nr:hypothetical protein F4821DRAFT_60121 [Hypoxylon rubiginosum]
MDGPAYSVPSKKKGTSLFFLYIYLSLATSCAHTSIWNPSSFFSCFCNHQRDGNLPGESRGEELFIFFKSLREYLWVDDRTPNPPNPPLRDWTSDGAVQILGSFLCYIPEYDRIGCLSGRLRWGGIVDVFQKANSICFVQYRGVLRPIFLVTIYPISVPPFPYYKV